MINESDDFEIADASSAVVVIYPSCNVVVLSSELSWIPYSSSGTVGSDRSLEVSVVKVDMCVISVSMTPSGIEQQRQVDQDNRLDIYLEEEDWNVKVKKKLLMVMMLKLTAIGISFRNGQR